MNAVLINKQSVAVEHIPLRVLIVDIAATLYSNTSRSLSSDTGKMCSSSSSTNVISSSNSTSNSRDRGSSCSTSSGSVSNIDRNRGSRGSSRGTTYQ